MNRVNKTIYHPLTTSELITIQSFEIIVKSKFPYGENQWGFYFRNPTIALY